MSFFSKMSRFDNNYKIRLLNDTFRKQEALKLYREALRFIKLFDWDDENGVSWQAILKHSARQEMESSKEEKDPQILASALVNARMALDDMQEKFKLQQYKVQNNLLTNKKINQSSSFRSPVEIIQERERMEELSKLHAEIQSHDLDPSFLNNNNPRIINNNKVVSSVGGNNEQNVIYTPYGAIPTTDENKK
ncbi:hypothetical protein ABK040_001639 [Willaertia magna]